LFIALSPENPDPMYRQVTDQIRDAIASGELQPNELLPSIRDLALALEVSVITIKRAYQDLETEGLIRSRRGLGSFVMEIDQAVLRQEKLADFRTELALILSRGRKFNISPEDVIELIEKIKGDGNDANI
jgi:DNA-binding transcriptional regulator YhcF (GntR family)